MATHASGQELIVRGAGSGANSPTLVAPGLDGQIVIPDAGLLFRGNYSRSGPDLHITGPGGASALLPDYFTASTPSDLFSADGAVLTGDVVTRLAGPRFPLQYAQAAPPTGQNPIGQVETVAGTATATHANGSVEQLGVRSPVFLGDIIQTGANSTVGITFADRTVLAIDASSRMTLDQFVYNPGGAGNASVMNLVQGSFSFIAGQIAPTGDMRIETPVSSMAIRGTTGRGYLVASDGATAHILFRDPPAAGGGLGGIDVNNKLTGALIRALRLENEGVIVRSTAGDFQDLQRTPQQIAADQVAIGLVSAALAVQIGRITAGEPVVNPTPGGLPGLPGPPGQPG